MSMVADMALRSKKDPSKVIDRQFRWEDDLDTLSGPVRVSKVSLRKDTVVLDKEEYDIVYMLSRNLASACLAGF